MHRNALIVGTRKSKLALTQTGQVVDRLKALNPGVIFHISPISTAGDRIPDRTALPAGQGIFVKELEEALLKKEIDLAVHSLKDMPCDVPRGLKLGAVPERVNPQDALLAHRPIKFHDLKAGARIGTSSVRRKAQLLLARKDISILDLRGNVDTRIRKLESGEVDAIILAAAGISRLSLDHLISELLPLDILLPAPCQGALAIEIRNDDARVESVVKKINHMPSFVAVTAERAFLRRLGGGCSLPVGALATVEEGQIRLRIQVVCPDGSKQVHKIEAAGIAQADALGENMADDLLASGDRWIKEILRIK